LFSSLSVTDQRSESLVSKFTWNTDVFLLLFPVKTDLVTGRGPIQRVTSHVWRRYLKLLHLHLVPILRMRGAILPLRHRSSWC